MMNIPDILISSLLQAANVIVLAMAIIAIMRSRKQAKSLARLLRNAQPVAPQPQPAPQQRAPSNPELEEKVSELQDVVWAFARKQQPPRDPVESKLPIENAVRMARHGASIDELIRGCGVNKGEALLLRKLHGKAEQVPQAG